MGHSVSSLSQLQPTLAAKRKNATKADKDNAAKKRRGKWDTEDDAKYHDKEDVLPLNDVAFGEKQREQRRLAVFNTATIIEAHCLKFMQRAFPPKPADIEKKKTQAAAFASITACRPQSNLDYIIYVLMHWQVSVKLHELDPGTERDRLMRFCRQHHNGTKITGKYCLERIQVPGENPYFVLRRQEKDKNSKLFVGWIVVSREQVFDAINEWHKAMRTWVRKEPGHIVGKSIPMSPRHSSKSTASCVLLAVRRIRLVMRRRAAGNQFGC
jgi:hypothetical protein